MILGIGTDILEIKRIKKVFDSEKKLERIFTENEILRSKDKIESLAGYFSSKESFSKALGTGIGEISFKDIEIKNTELGKPYIKSEKLDRKINEIFKTRNNKVHLSITHSKEYVVTMVIIEGD